MISISRNQSVSYPKPAFDGHEVVIEISTNDRYAPYTGVLIKSMVDHSVAEKYYDIVVLESDISEANKRKILGLIRDYPNISVRFFNAAKEMDSLPLKIHGYFSKETYYRLKTPTFFTHYKKAIHFDVDMIVCEDVSPLYDVDLEDYYAAVVPEILTHARCHDPVNRIKMMGMSFDDYIRSYLGVDDTYKYFQAGLIVFNIDRMKKGRIEEEFIRHLNSGRTFAFVDQCILNASFGGNVKLLDLGWNVLCGHWINNSRKYYKPDIYDMYLRSRERIRVAHFAGAIKPWEWDADDKAELFWNAASETPWHEELLLNLKKQRYSLKGVRNMLIPYVRHIAPLNSKRRDILRASYQILQKMAEKLKRPKK